jgi:hypothetical protein
MDMSMLTFFVRHAGKLDLDDDTLEKMWKERKIGIHYPRDNHNSESQGRDSTSINPNDYDGRAHSAMEALVELARDGGYVCACFRTHKQQLLIGKVRPNSRIELLYGRYGQMKPEFQGRQAVMKVLRLHKVRELLETDHPTILVGQPQQGTIVHWRRVGNLIRSLVKGERPQVGLNLLGTAQQETMCSEFLRTPHSGLPTLVHLLLPVGRTMKEVDILGLATDGRRVFAQVKYSEFKRGDPSFQNLLSFIKEGHVVFFCQHSRQEIIDGVAVVPIKDVSGQSHRGACTPNRIKSLQCVEEKVFWASPAGQRAALWSHRSSAYRLLLSSRSIGTSIRPMTRPSANAL